MARGHGDGSNSRGLVLLLITSGFFITGLLFDYAPMIIDDHIKRTIELATNDEILSYWSKPPVDVNSYYWLYEIVNPDQFQMEGMKPQLRQVGPFHFVSRLEKRIVSLSQNKFRITYNSTRIMRLNSSYSADQLDRPVTVLNPVYTSILEGARANSRDLDNQSRRMTYSSINKLTERYNESILSRHITPRLVLLGRPMPIVESLTKMARTFGLEDRLPDMSASNGKYGYISIMNNTLTGPFEIYTGYQQTVRSLGDLISYKGKRRLSYYDGKCNRLQASVGELRPTPVDPGRRLEMFQPGFCRIVHLDPTGEHKLREGPAISYVVSPDDFSSAATNPDNRCFCVNSSGPTSVFLPNDPLDDNHCSLEGVIDLGPCSYAAPLMMSLSTVPLDSRILSSLSSDFDPELLNGEVQELDMADDRAQIVILKRMGVPIRADFTLTLIMRVARDPSFKETANVPLVSYVPLVTARETVTIPPQLAQMIINAESFISLTYHIKVVMYLSAIILLCWLSGHYYSQTASVEPLHGPDGSQSSGRDSGGGDHGPRANARRATLSSGRGGSPLGGGGGGGPGVGDDNQPVAYNSGRAPVAREDETAGAENNKSPQGARQAEEPVSSRPGTVDVRRSSKTAVRGGDSFSSERANSADSNRSLPPSRHTSRLGSLSPANSCELESESAHAADVDADGQLRRLKRNGSTGPPAHHQSARVFSKVDELRGARLRASQTPVAPIAQQQPLAEGAHTAGGLADGQFGPPGSELDPAAGSTAAQRRASLLARKRRTNWFMNVYSNFVHMLNGLRDTINEAGQLEVGGGGGGGDGGGQHTNDHLRDRQLEMLAGKIDNWCTRRDDGLVPPAATSDAVTNQPEAGQVGGSGEAHATYAGAAGCAPEKTSASAAEPTAAYSEKSAQKATQTRGDGRDAEPTVASHTKSSQTSAGDVSGGTGGDSEPPAGLGTGGNEPSPVVSGRDEELLCFSVPPLAAAAATAAATEPNSIERNGLESGGSTSRSNEAARELGAHLEATSASADKVEQAGGAGAAELNELVDGNKMTQNGNATRAVAERPSEGDGAPFSSASFDSALDSGDISSASRDSKVTQVLAAGARTAAANQSSVGRQDSDDEIYKLGVETKNPAKSKLDQDGDNQVELRLKREDSQTNRGPEEARLDSRNGIENNNNNNNNRRDIEEREDNERVRKGKQTNELLLIKDIALQRGISCGAI